MNPPKRKPKIIVADEDKDVRFLIKMYLRNYHVDIIEARDGKECLSLIDKEHPMLVVLNYILDKLTGYQVAEKVSQNDSLKHIPVIMMTIEGFDLIEEKAGVTEYLVKPFGCSEFIEVIEKTIGKEAITKTEEEPDEVEFSPYDEKIVESQSMTGKKKILVADDEPYIVRLLTLILGRHYDVEVATSGESLVEMVEKGRYDLIISDVIMPKLSGWKSIKKIREMGCNTPVIFSSGLVKDKELYETLRPDGPSMFILKPFKNEELLAQVKELLS